MKCECIHTLARTFYLFNSMVDKQPAVAAAATTTTQNKNKNQKINNNIDHLLCALR